MPKKFIQEKFWNKTLLAAGHHDVKITCIEYGKNATTGTPFIICIFENQYGYFPKKINLYLKSEQNQKFIQKLYECVDLSEPLNVNNNYSTLLNKKLSVFIGVEVSVFPKKGLNINRFY